MADYDLAIIGGGPGGYVAAIRAAQLGMTVVSIEREEIGGVCLNWGCIPSKALIRNADVLNLVHRAGEFGIKVGEIQSDYKVAVDRSRQVVDRLSKGVKSLFRSNSIDLVKGSASFVEPNVLRVSGDTIEARNVIVATGASPAVLPGVDIDGELVMTYREAIVSNALPSSIVIIGAGSIGVEFAHIYNAYGVDVTVIESKDRVLPMEDRECSDVVTRSLKKRGVSFYTSASVTAVNEETGATRISFATADGKQNTLHADRVLVSVGIRGNTDALGLEHGQIQTENSFVKVDSNLCANSWGAFAIGDVTGIMPLAHVAQAQGTYVVEYLAGLQPPLLDYDSVPRAVYADPQVASIGLTEEQAMERGNKVKTGRFPFLANGKALAMGNYEGFAKVVIEAETGELLGAHLVGHEVTELLGELSLNRLLEGTSAEIGAAFKAHPTMSEAVKEAALAADGRAVHI